MILLIDNYDSFTFNLYQYTEEVLCSSEAIRVVRNDEITLSDIAEISPSRIIISPGPCTPNEAGISVEVIQRFYAQIPILGVCLGHQAIAQAFGGRVVRAELPMHGKTSAIRHQKESIFSNIESPFIATRYHSLIAEQASFPPCLKVTARSETDEIMALCHRNYPHLVGVQFHPESIMTSVGKTLLSNFFRLSTTQLDQSPYSEAI